MGVSASLTDEDAHTQGRLAARRVNVTDNRTPHSTSTSPSPSSSLSNPTPPLLGKRKSFVGTPCWMAPEVVSQKQYDSSADIWSLGITALELAQGRAPYSRDPPARVLAKILNNDPPMLDRTGRGGGGTHKYSRAFADVVALCLRKDPSARPTAEQLLALPFFRSARHNYRRYLVRTLLAGLPPLADRQERRRQPSITSNLSASSWDFSTMYTNTMSIFRRSSASVHCTSPSPTHGRSRSHAGVVERESGGLQFRTSSLRMRSLSIGDEYGTQEGVEEGVHALVLEGRRDRERTRGREEAVTPLLVSSAFAAEPSMLMPESETFDLDSASSDDDEEANKRHLDVDMTNSKRNSIVGGSGSGSGSGAGSRAGSSMLGPSALAAPSSASLSSESSPEDLVTPPAGTTPSSGLGGGTIKVWRKLRGKDKMRKGSTSSAGTSRLSGFFGTVLERKMSRK